MSEGEADGAWLAICAAFSLYLCWLTGGRAVARRLARFWPEIPGVTRYAGVITALVFGVTVAGTYGVHHAHDVIMEEYLPKIQAEIFLSGDFLARYSGEWADYVDALFPQFVYVDGGNRP